MEHLKIMKKNTTINFLGKKNAAFFLSILMIVASIGILFTKGLNFGIDFTGGIVVEIRTEEHISVSKLRSILSGANLGDVSLQNIGSEGDIMIRVGIDSENSEHKAAIIDTIKSTLSENIKTGIDYRKVDYVGPQVGEELIKSGAISLILSFGAIMLYIWLRFEWQFGVGAITALFHDVILTMGLFGLSGIEFNLTSIAAILTVVGYSINDSVVVFDRIRENLRKYKKMPLEELLNNSINDMLSRTLVTSGTTIAVLASLVLLGGDVIKGFSIAVLFGIIVGTYSSIFIASPILVFMNIRGENQGS